MIFNSNTTSLGNNVPVLEGYDASTGVAVALIESARNDYAMFRAMLDVDAKEMMINRSNGVVAESQIMALREGTEGGIIRKIKDFLKKLAAKIKSIFHNFCARIAGIATKDAELVKKYKKDVAGKSNLEKMEVKWRKLQSGAENNIFNVDAFKVVTKADIDASKWKEDEDDIFSAIAGCDKEDFQETKMKKYFAEDSAEVMELKETGKTITDIMSWLEGYAKKNSTLRDTITKFTNSLDKVADEFEKDHSKAANKLGDEKDGTTQEQVDDANKAYTVAKVYQDVKLKEVGITTSAIKIIHAQYRSAFMKAVTINPKKLKESSIYANAIAEEAEQEVEDVITGAIDKVDVLDDINNATYNVKDADVSDDPNKNVYDKVDYYTTNGNETDTDGVIDTDIDSKIGGKSEAAYFGQLLY